MTTPDYDIITVGGGLGGSALAKAMAEHGHRVLVIEREPQFKDRVRGEVIFPWGVQEAKSLGLYGTLITAGAHHPTYWDDYAGPDSLGSRDYAEDTPQKVRCLCIYHPRLQEALLQASEAAGAEVRRGTRVKLVEPGLEPKVVVEGDGPAQTLTARLVVGADGRSYMTRKWGGFESQNDPPGNLATGVLLENVPAPEERIVMVMNPVLSRTVLYLPQTRSTGRTYLFSRSEGGVRLHGDAHVATFLEECLNTGYPADLLDGARQAGPLATFECADSWVEHPYKDGVALIGDAAATSDPAWGQGLSLTLRDARTLRDALLASEDWNAAGNAYATEHQRYYQAVSTTASWFTKVMLEPGPEADAIRERVFPLMETDPFVLPDTLIAGPDHAPPTEEHRIKIFGEP